MINWKALIAGFVSTVIIGLINQLVFVLLAAYLGNVGVSISFMSEYKEEIWFVFGMLTYCFSMAAGGFFTGFFANKNEMLHGALAGGLASIISLLSSTTSGELTAMSPLLLVFGVVFGGLGGYFCHRASTQEPAMA